MNRVTIYSLDVLLSQLGTSLLSHVQFQLLLLDLHIDFSGGRSGGLVFPSLEEFSTVCCDPHSQRKCKKAKWSSEEALQIAEKRRDATCKGEKERYTHLNAELQKIARRDKKAFLSNQCKEIEGK